MDVTDLKSKSVKGFFGVAGSSGMVGRDGCDEADTVVGHRVGCWW